MKSGNVHKIRLCLKVKWFFLYSVKKSKIANSYISEYNTVKDNIFRCKIIVIIVIASKILRLKSSCLSNETGAIGKKLSKKKLQYRSEKHTF